MALLKGKGHSIYILKAPMYQDLPERSTNVVFFQNLDMSCCNGQLVELISKHKYLHHWQAD